MSREASETALNTVDVISGITASHVKEQVEVRRLERHLPAWSHAQTQTERGGESEEKTMQKQGRSQLLFCCLL